MLTEFVSPVQLSSYIDSAAQFPSQWGNLVQMNEVGKEINPEEIDLALIGVNEEKGAIDNEGTAAMPDEVRKHLYRLFGGDVNMKLTDLGNIPPGNTVQDTYAAVSKVVEELLQHRIVPILIGGSHDLTYGQYKGYSQYDRLVNLVTVDEQIDLGEVDEDQQMDAGNFLLSMFIEQPNNLFNFSQIGYQTYFVEPKAIETLEELNFDCFRLGEVRQNIEETEPIIRDADLLSFDLSAIRQSDAPATAQPTPHGFFGEEACQIAWYAGMSDKLTSFGFYGGNPLYDQWGVSAQMMAHIVWYFVYGFYNRKGDNPASDDTNYLKYLIDLDELDHQLVFYKSLKSGRWWMVLPDSSSEKRRTHPTPSLMPCSYKDYEAACREELPDRWLRAYHKLV